MQSLLLIFSFACLSALSSGAITPSDVKAHTINSATYDVTDKDLTASASDRTFHLNKDYGQLGGSVPYGTYYGSLYGPGQGYRGTGLNPGYLNVGYNRGYGPSGIVGGGNLGYGYYGNVGYNPGYGGGYGGYGGYGGGYGSGLGYGSYNTGSYGVGYDDGYNGYGRVGYGRNVGSDGYGYGSGYGGYGLSNYGSTYGTKSNYEPYVYQGNSYGSYSYPSGYRGYS